MFVEVLNAWRETICCQVEPALSGERTKRTGNLHLVKRLELLINYTTFALFFAEPFSYR